MGLIGVGVGSWATANAGTGRLTSHLAKVASRNTAIATIKSMVSGAIKE